MKNFSFIQRLRNKVKIKGTLTISISKSVKLVGCTISSSGNNNSLIIDDFSILKNVSLEIIGDNCSIIIGKNCMIGDNCYLSAKEETQIFIQDNCGFSRNVKVMTSDGHPIYQNKQRINISKSITFEKDIWVADNVTILKGVHIGTGSVIGINATLTKDIPAHSIAAGNPAKVIKSNISWTP